MDFFLTSFQHEFFQHGIIAAVLVGSMCGLIGVYNRSARHELYRAWAVHTHI